MKHTKWKKIAMIALTASVLSTGTVYALNPNWYQDGAGWHYYRENSGQVTSAWVQVDGNWYYFNAAGVMQTGWILLNGKKYYCGSDGAMITGWRQIDGKWYYFGEDGVLAVNTVTPDQYITGKEGELLSDYRMIAGVAVEKPPVFVPCTSTQMSGWQGITAMLQSIGNAVYSKTEGARRFHLYKDQVMWCSLESGKETELLSLKKVPETGGYKIQIRTPLKQDSKDEKSGAFYDPQILRLFCYSISNYAATLDNAIYSSFTGDNVYGIKRDTWVDMGDVQVLYKALDGAGSYEIRPVKGE